MASPLQPSLMGSPLLFFLLLLSFSSPSVLSSSSTDAALLLSKIKPALQGTTTTTNLELSSWNTSSPLCLWRGLRWSNGTSNPCSTSTSTSNLSLISDPALSLLSIQLPAAALAGTLPRELSLLPSLSSLLLPVNSLTGPVPLELFNSPSLTDLDLSSNSLSGSLPNSLWNVCPQAVSLRLSGNNFSGAVPNPAVSNSSCASLQLLNLAENRLTGDFPQFITGFVGLEQLDLASNRFSGEIPTAITNLIHLTTLNLSYNNFSGQIPTGTSKFGAAAFENNSATLCGAPLGDCGPGSAKLSPGAVAGILIGVLSAVVVFGSLAIGYAQGRRLSRNRGNRVEEEMEEGEEEGDSAEGKLIVFQGGEHLTLEDVLNATGQVLEKTSYGTVYKAKLADGGTIALRLLREGSCRDAAVCLPVVRQIGRVRQENLISLRCFYHGKRGEQLLIYDYLPNRTLHDLLYEMRAGRPQLNWSRRHKIALGVARGLAYLHTGQEEPITHGNVRSRNVLVDEFFVARLTEYSLDKLMVPAVADEIMAAAKLDGYKAPELQKMKKCSARTDVYAFGILLLEILMGKKPGREGSDLPALVKVAVLEETTMEVFDVEVLRGVRNPTEDGLVHALRLAMGCCSPVASVRPDMSEVVRQLEENRPRNRSALYSPADTRSEIGTPR